MLRSLLARRRPAQAATFGFQLDRDRVEPGRELGFRLSGLSEPVELALLRRELGPAGRLTTVCAARVVEPDPDGSATAALPVPAGLPPSGHGSRCELEFVARARSPVRGRSTAFLDTPVTVIAAAPPAEPHNQLPDRMIANFASRHFHIELSEAGLHGGGRIAGRVHLDRPVSGTRLELNAECREWWRTSPPSLWWRQPPTWSGRELWSGRLDVELEPGGHWSGFSFALPEGLPAAVEGYTIAWRYEIEARRPARLGPDERAVITPLRYSIG